MAAGEVVVGVDGSDNSISALRWAFDYARRAGATVVAVQAWEVPYVGDVAGMYSMPDRRIFLEHGEALLDDALSEMGDTGDVAVKREVVEGRPSRVLLDRSASSDLLVVGARGRGGFLNLLLGSVATQCVNHSKIPVVVVPNASTAASDAL